MSEMTMNMGSMYEEVPEIQKLNRVEGFDPRRYMRTIQDEGQPARYYLDVAFRKLWFRLKYPEGRIAVTTGREDNKVKITDPLRLRECKENKILKEQRRVLEQRVQNTPLIHI